MADENIVTNIVAKSDFSNLIADLNKVSFSLTKLQDQLVATNKTLAAQVNVMNRSFADTLRSTGQYSTHFVSLKSDVEKFGTQLEKGQLKLGQFFQVYSQHAKTSGGLVRDLARQQVQLQNAILQPLGKNAEGLMQYNVHIPKGLDLVKNKTAIAKQELMIMNRVVQEGANQLINWGKNTQWAGRQLTVGLTVPLAAFGKASADAFRQADEQLVRLTKVYGGIAQTSSQELGKVRDDVSRTAAELAKSYGAAFKDTLGLAADIAATGKTGNELLGSIKETTRLAVLGEVDRQEAMKATLAIQTAFKQNTDELSQSINFLNAVENQTSTTLNDLVEAIPKAGPIIKGLGGSVQDLALYLTAMREGGINATEGANALKSALASLINPTNVAVDKFKGFGIDLLGIVNSNAGNVTNTLFALQAALDRLDPLQKQQAIEQLFGKFQFSRLNALFENLGRQGSQTLQVLDLMKASSQELGDLASRELTAVTESASGRYRRALEGLKSDLAGIGEQFLRINTSLINFVDGIVQFVKKLPDPIKQALGFMGMLTAAAGPLIMLTGVLGNFFGYIIKGAYHFKALFKGGEGWKLLTPEILAAQKAGSLVEQTFYSDSKAAAILKQSINELALSYDNLAQKASMAAMTTNPTVSTVGGSTIIAGRVVNPSSPYVGAEGTRAAGHHIPRSQMSETQRLSQTIHSFTPLPIPLNQRIGAAPQVFTEGDLPRIPGLTTAGGVSTGIVAGEAAKCHALMGTLSMMTKREVSDLKKEIARTGTFSTEINTTFGQLLPAMTKLTSNAAQESALIVQQLQAGKLTVEAARAKIIAINAQLETMMAQTTTQVAADLGRTANLTQVPLVNQPIVSQTGKANIKEIFRPKRPSAQIIDKIARALGVRTWGGGYSTETTMPKRMNMGGNVVPGPNINADVVPALLTPGEFVVNREATAANLPLLTALNNNRGSMGPQFNLGSSGPIRFQRGHVGAQLPPNNLDLSQLATGTKNVKYVAQGIPIWMTSTMNQELRSGRPGMTGMEIWNQFATGLRSKRHPFETLSLAANQAGLVGEDENLNKIFADMMNDLSGPSANKKFVGGTADSFENYFNKKYVPRLSSKLSNVWHSYGTAYGSRGNRNLVATGTVHIDPKTGSMQGIRGRSNPLTRGITTSVLGSFSGPGFTSSKSRQANSINLIRSVLSMVRNPLAGSGFHTYKRVNRGGYIEMNTGGMVPMPPAIPVPPQNGQKYNRGGMVKGYQLGGMVAGLGGGMLGSTVGGMLGGQTGSMIGGMAGMMALPAMFRSSGVSADESVPKIGRFRTAINALIGLPGPVKLLGALLAVGGAVKTINDKINEHRRIINLAFAPTEQSAERLGIKYKSLTQQLKDFSEESKLSKARIEEYYAATQNSGIPGLNLTIKQLKELKATIEKDFPDYIKMFNIAKSGEVVNKAQQLKAQLVAGGMSAEDATKKIYAMISVSNKAAQAVSAIANEGFVAIKDKSTAAAQSVKSFNTLLSQGNTDQLASAFESAVFAIQEAEKSLIGTKNAQKENITEAEAFDTVLNSIKNKNIANTKLGEQGVEALSKQNSELAFVLSKTDTLEGAYAKIKLYLSGIDMDFKSINSEAAILVAKTTLLATQSLTSADGKYGSIVKKIKELNTTASSNSAAKSQQKVQEDLDEQIKKRQKIIDQIREQADEAVKALDRQNESENFNVEIKKLQLEYQNALAAGDMSRAAQAQLSIQSLSRDRQKDLAVEAIRDKEKLDIKAQESIIEGLKSKLDASQKIVENATEKANAALTKAADLQNTLNELVALTLSAANGQTELERKQTKNIQNKLREFGLEEEAQMLQENIPLRRQRLPKDFKAGGIQDIGITTLESVIDANGDLKSHDSKLLDWFKTNLNKPEPVIYTRFGTVGRGGTGYSPIRKAMGGYIKNYEVGGGVYGPGTSTSDSIPAMLSNGEYVLRASAVRSIGVPLLDEINKMAMGGLAARYDIAKKTIMPANTMGYNRGGQVQNYNVGGLTMNFQNGGQVDGRMLFEQFKSAMALERLKSGSGKVA